MLGSVSSPDRAVPTVIRAVAAAAALWTVAGPVVAGAVWAPARSAVPSAVFAVPPVTCALCVHTATVQGAFVSRKAIFGECG